jgi:hypothetical protein
MCSRGSMEPSGRMDRRRFLRLSGAAIASVALFGVMGKVSAQVSSGSSLVAEFREAAEKYDVPVGLLLAIGYVNTRLEMPPPEASAYEPGDLHGTGAYGIMQLVQNPSSDTLGEASRLTGISEEELKTDRRSNILGGAALLAESQGERAARLEDYFGAVAGKGGRGKIYEAVAGIGAGELFAGQVFDALRSGSLKAILDDEQISLSTLKEQL